MSVSDDFTVPCDNFSVDSSAELINITKDSEMMLLQLNSSSSAEEPDLSFYVVYVFGILLPLSLFIITGNLSVFVVAACHTSSSAAFNHRATCMFIASLAVADCLVGVSLVPVFYLGIFTESLKTDFYFCLSITSCIMVSCGISMLHVLCIAVDRYLAVQFPLLYHNLMTHRRITIIIIATWSVVIGIGLVVPYMGWRKPVEKLEYCYLDQVLQFSHFVFMFIFTFTVPLFITIVLYIQIIRVAQRHVRSIAALTAHTSRASIFQPPVKKVPRIFSGNMKSIKTTAIIVCVFVLCWLPPYIFNFTMYYLNSNRPPGSDWIRSLRVEAALNTLAFSNSAANPIIYTFRYKEFRRGMKNILNKLCKLKNTVWTP